MQAGGGQEVSSLLDLVPVLLTFICCEIILLPVLRWIEACLGEELPAPTELEEVLRNGVILAKLGHRFAPNAVGLKKIYDSEQHRYHVRYTHTQE